MKFQSLVLFGPPGSGKGTIGKLLGQAAEHFHLSSGDIFRGLSKESPAGKTFHSYLAKGVLCPDDVTMQVWRSYVDGLIATNRFFPSKQCLILDGIPRTKEQVTMIQEHVDIIGTIVLEVPLESIINRLKRRAGIEGRSDDADVEVVKKRFSVYQDQTEPVLDAIDSKLIHRVNGDQGRLEVLRDVLNSAIPLLSK